MPLFVFYMHEASSYPAISRDNCHLQPAKAVKGQALVDLIAERINTDIAALSIRAWAMYFDGSV
jgi:hypothetical protein